jgi:hypothetical protein
LLTLQEFVLGLIRFYKQQRRLPTVTAKKILSDAKAYFIAQQSLVDVHVGRDDVINVCGDIHGQFFDLARY